MDATTTKTLVQQIIRIDDVRNVTYGLKMVESEILKEYFNSIDKIRVLSELGTTADNLATMLLDATDVLLKQQNTCDHRWVSAAFIGDTRYCEKCVISEKSLENQ